MQRRVWGEGMLSGAEESRHRPHRKAGGLTEDAVEQVITMMQNTRQDKIPDWFLHTQKDVKDGHHSQALASVLDNKLHEDLERLKKIRAHRGLHHFWGLRV